MKTRIINLLMLAIAFNSCNKILPGEHGYLVFENTGPDKVYVDGGILDETIVSYRDNCNTIGWPKDICEVAPYSINYNTCPIYASGVAYSYEYVFSRTKSAKTCLVYVVPFYSTEEIGENEPLYNHKLVCYELTYEDLVLLDFHLYYPPNEKMKNVKMDPPYETFETNRAVVDVMK